MANNTLTTDDMRERLDELVGLWFSTLGSAKVEHRDNPIVPMTVYAHVAHVHTLARAIRHLDAAGERIATIPLARQVLECTVTAVWAETFNERAAFILQHELAKNRIATLNDFVTSKLENDASVLDKWAGYLDELESVAKERAGSFYARAEELEGMLSTYAMYRFYSSFSHAGGSVVDLYVESVPVSDTAPHGIALIAESKEWAHEGTIYQLLGHVLLAATAWDKMTVGNPNQTRLEEIATEIGLSVPLQWGPSAEGRIAQEEWDRRQAGDALPVSPLPDGVAAQDRRLASEATKAASALAAHAWHWTLDTTNRERVSVRDYAEGVGRNRDRVEQQARAEQKRRKNGGRT